MDWIRRWIEDSPYTGTLGVRVDQLDAEFARLSLPFSEANSNGDRALHGGVAASLIAVGVSAVARSALGEGSGPWHIAALQIAYLSAALGEDIESEGRLLRRGKDLVHAEAEVRTVSGRRVARGLACIRGRFGAPLPEPPRTACDSEESEPGPMGRFIERVPFHKRLGLRVEHMAGGRARIRMPWCDALADAAGGFHDGAVLGLLDTAGAMAAWAETGPGPYKASTPGLQIRFLDRPEAGDLVACARLRHRDRELLFTEVEIASAVDTRLLALGSVNYRIVTPDFAR